MANSEENINKDKNENRNINIEQNSPEILTNPIYNPMGYMYHTLHPTDNTLNFLDNPMLVLNNSKFDCCA